MSTQASPPAFKEVRSPGRTKVCRVHPDRSRLSRRCGWKCYPDTIGSRTKERKGAEEDSASSRTKLFIDDGYMSFVLHPSSPIAAVAERTIPPPYPLPSLSRHVGINEERRGKFVIMLCVLVIV